MRSFLRFVLPLVALLAAAPAVRALPAAKEIKTAFQRLDLDTSQTISLAEWEQNSFDLFKATDKDGDNTLDLAEIQNEAFGSSTFINADKNNDRRLDVDEYMHLRRAIFATADIDHSDSLDFVEFEVMRLLSETGWSDNNKNRRVEFSELRASLTRAFQKADLNRDGLLTADEANFLQPDQFKAIAKDGSVDLETLIASYKRRVTGSA